MPRVVIGVEQHYDWGHPSAIAEMLGRTPERIAELWFGTHPQGHSHLDTTDGPLLDSVTGEMTMLVKILACAQPLSLQTHPTLAQAQRGFEREEAREIPRSAPQRMYRDSSDKPEMLIALSAFEALCGFAPIDDSLALFADMGWRDEHDVLDANGIDGYLLWAFDQLDAPTLDRAPQWLQRVAALHPDDRGLRVAPLLHHRTLSPGEALALPAGNLHAYLSGTGLEVMKSSDNVVRAGFTSKHIDVQELLRIVDTSPLTEPVVRPSHDNGWDHYPSPTPSFSVSRCSTDVVPADDAVRIVVVTNEVPLRTLLLMPGESCDVGPGGAWVCRQDA